MSKGLFKKAAVAIRSLITQKESLEKENSTLRDEVEKHAAAKELSFKLWKMGMFPAEDLEEQFNNLLDRPKDEINTFEKAASMFRASGFNLDLGSLSKTEQITNDTAEERFISTLFED